LLICVLFHGTICVFWDNLPFFNIIYKILLDFYRRIYYNGKSGISAAQYSKERDALIFCAHNKKMKNSKNLKSFLAALLAALTIAGTFTALTGCSGDTTASDDTTTQAEQTVGDTTAKPEDNEPEETTTAKEDDPEPVEKGDDEKEDPEVTTEEETKEPEPEETTTVNTDKPSGDYLQGKEDKTAAEDVDGEKADAVEIAEGVNPLTGIYTGNDYSDKRPVAIMINNLKASLPQVGISKADILYECLVEGGTTRLMMVKMDYEDIGVTGSVRSSRDYYIDLAQNHDAIYVHAGGSNDAYVAIKGRNIANLDGVNMYLPSTFYRDEERRKTMSIEHTLVTTGKGIVEGIKYKGYRTTLRDGFVSPFNFADEDTQIRLSGKGTAKHVIIPYNSYQFPQYIYDSKAKVYTRYQFKGDDHIDGDTGDRLTFKNLLVLVCEHTALNDDKNHISVNTAGSGKGYYITNGKYVEIKWSKPTVDSNLTLTNTDGSALVMNAGNTMVNLVSPGVANNMFFNYVEADK